MDKKGINLPFELIIALIVVLFVGLALFYFQEERFKPESEEFFDVQSCRLSVEKATLPGQGVTSLEELKGCKIDNIITEEIEPELIHELLAKSMIRCWYSFGGGALNFRSDFDDQMWRCFPCAKITFKNKVDGVSFSTLVSYTSELKGFTNLEWTAIFNELKENNPFYVVIITSKIPEQNSSYLKLLLSGINTLFYKDYVPDSDLFVLLVDRENIKEEFKKLCTY